MKDEGGWRMAKGTRRKELPAARGSSRFRRHCGMAVQSPERKPMRRFRGGSGGIINSRMASNTTLN